MVVEFTVKGESLTKGSMQTKAFQGRDGKWRSSARNNNPNLAKWEGTIRAVAQTAVDEMPFLDPTPVRVEATFYLTPPQRPESDYPVNQKDVDKLARCALDAMTGVVYSDDEQVTDLHVKKRYAADRRPRVVFRISEDDEPVERVPPLKRARAPARSRAPAMLWNDQMYR